MFRQVSPEEFRELLVVLPGAFHETISGNLILIDGKSLRDSFDRVLGQFMKHVMSAYVGDSGATVTFDVTGCQTSIEFQIVQNAGDYVIGLKGNLHESGGQYFAEVSPEECEKSDDT
jgi:hypothetical protein